MARPNIPDELIDELESLHEQQRGYEANTVQEAIATVTDMAKRSDEPPVGETDPQDIEDPVKRAIELDTTSPSDLKTQTGEGDLGNAMSLLGLRIGVESGAAQGVTRTQKAIKSIRQREANGDLSSHTADRLVSTYRTALDLYLEDSGRANEFQYIQELEDAIDEFLHANYIEEELGRKTGFTDFDLATAGLREVLVQQLDKEMEMDKILTEPLDDSTLPQNWEE